ncbi:MAG: ABC transporter ATP-binding protein, partial [Chloroflexota bacterium]
VVGERIRDTLERILRAEQLRVYARLYGYLRPYWRQLGLGYIAILADTVLGLIVPQVIKNAIDEGLAAGRPTALFSAAGLVLAIGIGQAIAGFGHRYLGEWLSHRTAYDLRNRFYDSVQRLPFAFHDRTQTGDLMSRATTDISEVQRFVGIGAMELTATLLVLVGVVVAMFLEDARLALLALVPMPVLIVATIRFGNVVRPMFKRIQEQMSDLSATMQESLTGIRVTKAFAREPFELDRFNRENDEWFHRRRDLIRVWANNWPLFTFILAFSIFLLLLFGGPLALEGDITVGMLFAMISYLLLLNGPVQQLGFLVNLAATANASASRVFEIVDAPSDIQERPGAVALDRVEGAVTFENVSFAYADGRPVLQDVSFHAQPGQCIALMGPTGSGKSTVTRLIPRFYDPLEGCVKVDGIDLRDVKVASLRRHVASVLQDPFLFGLTIRENIAYGRPGASQDEIVVAARAARAHDFIMGFPDGYETRVGERGVTLSGGQRQRLAIARALLYDPRILILDDSTSSVDTETEHLIQEALQELMEGRTTFVIAQRLLTLKDADKILVLNHGRIVQRGTHEELLAVGGLYKEVYDSQLRDQEEFAALEKALGPEPQEAGGT